MVFIVVTILLDMLALGLIRPILPKLVESFVNNDTADAARIFGLFGTAWALMQFFFSPVLGALHLLRSHRVLAGLSVVNFVAQTAHVVLPSTYVLYATYRYGWDTTTVGLTLAMVGICAMVVQGLAIGPIVRRFGEWRALLLGLGSGAIGFLIFALAPTGPLSWLGIPVMALWGVSGAAIQSLMT